MGRHGGGSRSGGGSSGGSSRSSSSGGSRSGGSSVRTSRTPFSGCYNRSYYDRFGRHHAYYTTDATFGTRSGWNGAIIFALLFITIHMFLMVGGFTFSLVSFGGKVNGNQDRIFIEDKIDILTSNEEAGLIKLFEEVYEESGMPVTLYTDDFSWKNRYNSLAVYSEELYYKIGLDEDAMIILFTADDVGEFWDWEYDMYCGDDTIKCISDETFDRLLSNFQKAMAKEDLFAALTYSWNSVIDDLAKTTVATEALFIFPFFVFIYGTFYVVLLRDVIKNNAAYKYFKEHPEELEINSISY